MAFSLQQLVFDLDHMVLQSVPTIESMDKGSNAYSILHSKFIDIYIDYAKKHGLPPVAVAVISQESNPSQLCLTSFERQVTPVIDDKGHMASNQSAATLDFLCAVNKHELPRCSPFEWSWVDPEAIQDKSGVMVAKILLETLLPMASKSCY